MATQLFSKLGGIDPEKLSQHRATFICQYGLHYCIVWPSFLFYCFVKIWTTCENFLDKWFTASPGKKLPVRLWPRARKKCRGKQETKSSVSPYFSSVLISRFLSTLQKDRAQSRLLLYLFYDKESVKFPTRSYFKTNFFFKANVSVVIVFYTDSHKTRLKQPITILFRMGQMI